MIAILGFVLASAVAPVPDAGSSGILFGAGILAIGLVARFLKNRKR